MTKMERADDHVQKLTPNATGNQEQDAAEWTVVSDEDGTAAICDGSGFKIIGELPRITCKLIVNSHNASIAEEREKAVGGLRELTHATIDRLAKENERLWEMLEMSEKHHEIHLAVWEKDNEQLRMQLDEQAATIFKMMLQLAEAQAARREKS